MCLGFVSFGLSWEFICFGEVAASHTPYNFGFTQCRVHCLPMDILEPMSSWIEGLSMVWTLEHCSLREDCGLLYVMAPLLSFHFGELIVYAGQGWSMSPTLDFFLFGEFFPNPHASSWSLFSQDLIHPCILVLGSVISRPSFLQKHKGNQQARGVLPDSGWWTMEYTLRSEQVSDSHWEWLRPGSRARDL